MASRCMRTTALLLVSVAAVAALSVAVASAAAPPAEDIKDADTDVEASSPPLIPTDDERDDGSAYFRPGASITSLSLGRSRGMPGGCAPYRTCNTAEDCKRGPLGNSFKCKPQPCTPSRCRLDPSNCRPVLCSKGCASRIGVCTLRQIRGRPARMRGAEPVVRAPARMRGAEPAVRSPVRASVTRGRPCTPYKVCDSNGDCPTTRQCRLRKCTASKCKVDSTTCLLFDCTKDCKKNSGYCV